MSAVGMLEPFGNSNNALMKLSGFFYLERYTFVNIVAHSYENFVKNFFEEIHSIIMRMQWCI